MGEKERETSRAKAKADGTQRIGLHSSSFGIHHSKKKLNTSWWWLCIVRCFFFFFFGIARD